MVRAPLWARSARVLAGRLGAPGRVACQEGRLHDELPKLGVAIDPEAPVAWASSLGEVRALRPTRKLILCGRLDYLPAGGCMAVVVEDERPAIYMHMRNIGQSKILVPIELYDLASRISK